MGKAASTACGLPRARRVRVAARDAAMQVPRAGGLPLTASVMAQVHLLLGARRPGQHAGAYHAEPVKV